MTGALRRAAPDPAGGSAADGHSLGAAQRRPGRGLPSLHYTRAGGSVVCRDPGGV